MQAIWKVGFNMKRHKRKLCEGCYYNDGIRCISHHLIHSYDIDGNLLHIDTYGKYIEWLRDQADLIIHGCSSYRSVPFLKEQK